MMIDKKVAVMQPYFFPYIGYFQLINAVDTFVIYDDVNFIKSGYVNRNSILAQNAAMRFNILLKKASSFKKINEIEINYDIDWTKKLIKQINQNYSKAPYYNAVNELLEKILNQKHTNLAEFLSFSISEICKYIGINTLILMSSKIYDNQHLDRKERLIEICKKENANQYVNAIGGMDLYSKEEFAKENISLSFINTKSIEYVQFSNEFVPYLSIIDVLMFNSKDAIKEMLNKYELI